MLILADTEQGAIDLMEELHGFFCMWTAEIYERSE